MSSKRNTRQQTSSCKAYFEIDLGGEELTEVEFTGQAIYGNYGIGQYEYWGQKCNDVQMGYEIDGYEWDQKMYSGEENKLIEEWADKNDSKIIDKLYDSIETD